MGSFKLIVSNLKTDLNASIDTSRVPTPEVFYKEAIRAVL